MNASDMRIESGYIEVDNGKLYYEVAGQGEGEDIVLIHDGMIHSRGWDYQFSHFARDHRVIRYDRRGYGKSPAPEQPYSNVADLYGIFEQLNVDSAIVMGISAGGGLAIDFTLEHPDRVTALVLIGAVVRGLPYTEHLLTRGGHMVGVDRSDLVAFLDYFINNDPYEMALSSNEARARAKEMLEGYADNLNPVNGQMHRPIERIAVEHLNEITVPTLILAGEYDIPDVHAHAGAINAGIPNSRRIVVKDAGHLVMLERPDFVNDIIPRALQEVRFFAVIENDGISRAAELYENSKKKGDTIYIDESRMNGLGYNYLFSGKVDEAVTTFELNIKAHPNSYNVYDSHGEALSVQGDTVRAIEQYEKSLELNPENTNATKMIEKLRGQ